MAKVKSIVYSRDHLLTPFGIKTLVDRYLLPGEASPQDAFARAAAAFADDDDHAQRLYDYASNLWFMFSTPILSNGGSSRGLPISCFLNYVPDSRTGITDHHTENAFLTSLGGGIGGSWSALRGKGEKTSKGSESTGIIPFIKIVDSQMLAFSQGVTRRGSYAAWLSIDHPEIEEFLDIRKPSGGDFNRKSINLHHGVVLSDKFMEIIDNATKIPGFDDSWHLIDPNSKRVVKTVSAKALWIKIMHNRVELGEPYIMFGDTVNNALPQEQKDKGLYVPHSNLCSEITLPSDADRTAVCCLSSVNLETYDSWKNDPNFIPDLIRMLDNALDSFIKAAPPELHKAVYSAMMERSIGLGAMGFHAYLQSKMIPFESVSAKAINKRMFKHIKAEAVRGSEILYKERGPCPDGVKSKKHNMHLLAIAPNASSSIICGETSPSIEPFRANAYTQKTMTGSSIAKNEYLQHYLDTIGFDEQEVWENIVAHQGSIQHLDFIDNHTKDVFKTAMEIDQRWIIDLAADRQEEGICQSQSLNLFFKANVHKKELHNIHLMAHKRKVKTLYYVRSETLKRANDLNFRVGHEVEETKYEDYQMDYEEGCVACEG